MAEVANKQIVVGSGGVGKSCLIIQFITSKFVEDYDPTLEDSYRKIIDIDDRPTVLDIYDTAGQEDFAAVRDSYLRMGDGFICVYSVAEKNSFHEIAKLREHIYNVKDMSEGEKFPFVLVGNKSDLTEARQVTTQEGQELATKWGCPFFESSAKNRVNIAEIFVSLARETSIFNNGEPPKVSSSGGPEASRTRTRRTCQLF